VLRQLNRAPPAEATLFSHKYFRQSNQQYNATALFGSCIIGSHATHRRNHRGNPATAKKKRPRQTEPLNLNKTKDHATKNSTGEAIINPSKATFYPLKATFNPSQSHSKPIPGTHLARFATPRPPRVLLSNWKEHLAQWVNSCSVC
jgi:hypothetical protein